MKVRAADGPSLDLSERGEGPPVLLVHGFGGGGRAWGEAVLDGLARHHRVLAVDLIGHGGSEDPSDPSRVTLERVLDDLERVLDAAGTAACPWIGYSMGGRIALAAAVLRPGRIMKLVLESASPGLATEVERSERRSEDEARARRIEEKGIDAWIAAWEDGPLFQGRGALAPDVREPFLEQRRANRPTALAAWLRGMGTGSQPSFWGRLRDVRSKTLLVSGARDAKFTELAQRMEAGMRDARHVIVPTAGHTVHLECPADWLEAVLPFLDG